ncbi:MAG: glycerol-3-phosphate dehydrogenase/oxidase [Thermodesulfobacteriota bacterium]
MKRNLIQLSGNCYDVVIVGGGIYGLCVAREAVLKGLSVALVEKGDFGHATSFNTLRLIHGGFRYLQSLDISRSRRSFYEQMIFMNIAPHLVHPMPVFIPAYGHFIRGRGMLSLALKMYDNLVRGVSHDDYLARIPRGKVISRKECLQTFPDIDREGLTGGIIFYDCQVSDSERLVISIAKAAAGCGVDLANYLEVIGFIKEKNRIGGVRVKDILTEDEFEIRGKFVVNTCGPWVKRILGLIHNDSTKEFHGLSKAFNLVITRKFSNDFAIGVYSQIQNNNASELLNKRSRFLFFTPWKNYSLIGTEHVLADEDPDKIYVTDEEINNFLGEINQAYPQAELGLEDVCFKYIGFLPTTISTNGSVRLATKYHIYDHGLDSSLEGLISVIGVKFTEARYVAEKVADLIFKKMGIRAPASCSDITPVYGGRIEQFNEFLNQESRKNQFGLSRGIMQNLIFSYGSAYTEVLKYLDQEWNSDSVNALDFVRKAEILYAIREEMAQKLADVLLRRTDMSTNFELNHDSIMASAKIMAKELNWNNDKIEQETNEVKTSLSFFTNYT